MRLSYVIVTWNRCDRLLDTLARLVDTTPLPRDAYEIIVADNASTDGTADEVRRAFPQVNVIQLNRNEGMAGRNHAIRAARGEYITLLDDDSYPLGDAVIRSMNYMDATPRTAAVVGRAMLPNGRPEASALPTVMIGCATTIRRDIFEQVGLFPREFFRQAEEYDLSFRIWEAGYAIERFEDVAFRHDKHVGGRSSELTLRMDLRNNAILAERYLAGELRKAYRADWLQRYHAIAASNGMAGVARKAALEARWWAMREAIGGRRTLRPATVEMIFGLQEQLLKIDMWAAAHRVRRVVIADLSKNIYATWRACAELGIEVCAIADGSPAYQGLNYRGTRVMGDDVALARPIDGIVIANVNPAQLPGRYEALRQSARVPVLRLWDPRYLDETVTTLETMVA